MTPSEQTHVLNVGVILLAAGASSRLGEPKQLLPYKNESLLRHSLQAALAATVKPVIVVLGANAAQIKSEVANTPAAVAINESWQEGMASSIRCGINKLAELAPAAEAAIIMVCDQPFVSPALLNEIVLAYKKTGKHIVACSYENSFGPPVLFHRSLFPALLQLKGDAGARGMIRSRIDETALVPFPQGAFDVDTKADYEKIKNGFGL